MGVVLFFRAHGTGAQVLGRLREFLLSVIEAIAGWQPEGTIDVYSFVRSTVLARTSDALAYQIDFSTTDQLRVLS